MPINPAAFERLRVIHRGVIPVTDGDMAGPLLKQLGQIHRAQERRVFAKQAQGEIYPWARLKPATIARKRRILGSAGKILVFSGETKARFITASRPQYIQRYVKPFMNFGASSDVAGYHVRGSANLPKRDMITKSSKQLREMRQGILAWWRGRVAQVLRGQHQLDTPERAA